MDLFQKRVICMITSDNAISTLSPQYLCLFRLPGYLLFQIFSIS